MNRFLLPFFALLVTLSCSQGDGGSAREAAPTLPRLACTSQSCPSEQFCDVLSGYCMPKTEAPTEEPITPAPTTDAGDPLSGTTGGDDSSDQGWGGTVQPTPDPVTANGCPTIAPPGSCAECEGLGTELRELCLDCLFGAQRDHIRTDTDWLNGVACTCAESWDRPRQGNAVTNGCEPIGAAEKAEILDTCGKIREPDQPECKRCLKLCGPGASWNEFGDPRYCISPQGTPIDSSTGFTPR